MVKKDQSQEEIERVQNEAKRDAEYKEKYKVVLKIVSDDGEHVLYLRQPSRLSVGSFMAKYGENRVEAVEHILIDCCIQEISDYNYFIQDEVFYGIMSDIISLVRLKKSHSTTL